MGYSKDVQERLLAASEAANAPCPLIRTIAADDMQVSLMMSLCRRSGVSYDEVFSTRSADLRMTSAGSSSRASQSLMKLPSMIAL